MAPKLLAGVTAARYRRSVTTIDDHGRPEPPVAADELDTLVGFLDYQRATLRWRCEGLDARQLAVTTAASTMTLAGLLRHMSLVEDYWFSERLWNHEPHAEWRAVDWDSDPDWDWHSATTAAPEDLMTSWLAAQERSRTLVASALTTGGLDQLAQRAWPNGSSPSLRWILCHMIEEYARHNGHADLLREVIDGVTGE